MDDDYKERYELLKKQVKKITEEAKEKLPKQKEITRKAIINEYSKYGKEIIGVFGGYRSFEGRGEEIIRDLANNFAQMEYVVVTGLGIFYKINDEIRVSTILANGIFKIMSSIDGKGKSELLASIPKKAIFLLSSERNSSQYEFLEFVHDEYGDKNLGIGVMISQEKNLPCSFIKERIVNSTRFYVCEAINSIACNENRNKCPFIDQLKLPFSEVEQYVNTDFTHKIIIQKKEDILKIVDKIFSGEVLI